MKKSLITVLAVIAVMLSSCTSIHKTASTLDIPTSIVSKNVADLKVNDERITFTYTPSREVRKGGEQNVLNAAIAEALKANGNADLLVAMQYEMKTTTGFFGQKTIKYVTVTGHPAFYTNIHPAEPEQVIILNGQSAVCTDFRPIK